MIEPVPSRIDPSRIDESFPVQGQDNPSQGFRNNFLYIKQGLATARAEITDLQNKVVVKSALTNLTNAVPPRLIDNNLNGNKLENILVNQVAQTFKNNGNKGGGNLEIFVTEHQVQKIKFISNSTLKIRGWPPINSVAKSYKMRLHLCGDGLGSYRILFTTDSQGVIKYAGDGAAFPNPFFVTTNDKVIDIWSYDGGVTVFFKYLGEFV
jgi:hypothetical protein